MLKLIGKRKRTVSMRQVHNHIMMASFLQVQVTCGDMKNQERGW